MLNSLADSLAQAGYLVVVPGQFFSVSSERAIAYSRPLDLFKGDPVPADALSNPNSTFNITEWQTRHPQAAVESIIESAINSIRTEFNASRVGSVGYCFGKCFEYLRSRCIELPLTRPRRKVRCSLPG